MNVRIKTADDWIRTRVLCLVLKLCQKHHSSHWPKSFKSFCLNFRFWFGSVTLNLTVTVRLRHDIMTCWSLKRPKLVVHGFDSRKGMVNKEERNDRNWWVVLGVDQNIGRQWVRFLFATTMRLKRFWKGA